MNKPPGIFSGGCYLLDTVENAVAFQDWVTNDFILDGMNFFDRGAFLEAHGHLWHVAGIEDFGDIDASQHLMRFQRYGLFPTHRAPKTCARSTGP